MKKYYIPAIVVLNNIHGNNMDVKSNNKAKNLKEISNLLKNTYRYTVVHNELKITQSLNAYKELETYKMETEENIKKANDEARITLEKYYQEYQELMKNNASQSEQEACAAKIQKQTNISENKIKLLQDEFQMKSFEKVNLIRDTVKEAIEVVCSKIIKELKETHKSTDNIIVVSENKDNVLGLTTDDLNNIDITDFVIKYLEEKGKITNRKYSNNSSRNSSKNNNRSTNNNRNTNNKTQNKKR